MWIQYTLMKRNKGCNKEHRVAEQSVIERVRAGATLLDSRVVGWAMLIDTARFDMSMCAGCAIGQTLGDYYSGCETLGLSDKQSVALGFHSSVNILKDYDGAMDEYAALRSAWLAEIAARLAPAVEDETDLAPVATYDCPL
jgi:hypothetical protein